MVTLNDVTLLARRKGVKVEAAGLGFKLVDDHGQSWIIDGSDRLTLEQAHEVLKKFPDAVQISFTEIGG